MLIRFRRWLGEEGMALPLVLAAMVILAALSVGAWTASSNVYFMSSRDRLESEALAVAEGGLEAAVWQLKGHFTGMSFPADLTYTLPNGTATVRVTAEGWQEYKVVSRGLVTGAGGQQGVRYVKTSVFILSLWNFIMGAGSLTAGGGGVNGTTSVKGPFYVRGNLQLSGNSSIMDGPLFVKNGNLVLQGSSSVGDPSITPTRVPCYIDGTHPPLTDPDFYATLNTNVPDISLPPLRETEMSGYYARATAESDDDQSGDATGIANIEPPIGWPGTAPWNVGWASSPGYKVVDDNGTMATPIGSGTTAFTLSAATASFGNPANDDFAWDAATGVLTVKGTVFVDGPVTLSRDFRYDGNGAIVANGQVRVSGRMQPVGTYPDDDVLGLTTPSVMIIDTNDSGSSEANPAVAGAFFSTQRIEFNGNQAYIRGSLLSGNLTFAHPNIHIITDPQLPNFLPKSMPGQGTMLTFPTHWQEGR